MAGIYLFALISAAIATSSALPVRSVPQEQAEEGALREVKKGLLTFYQLAVSECCMHPYTLACIFCIGNVTNCKS